MYKLENDIFDENIIILIIGIPIFLILILISYIYDYWKWNYIEKLNKKVNINKLNSFLDTNNYLRWKSNNKLCHKDIAWNYNIDGYQKNHFFEIRHIDGNIWNNDPKNLEYNSTIDNLTKYEQLFKNKFAIMVNEQIYYKIGFKKNISSETEKAICINYEWYPKSQIVYNKELVYISSWLYHKRQKPDI